MEHRDYARADAALQESDGLNGHVVRRDERSTLFHGVPERFHRGFVLLPVRTRSG